MTARFTEVVRKAIQAAGYVRPYGKSGKVAPMVQELSRKTGRFVKITPGAISKIYSGETVRPGPDVVQELVFILGPHGRALVEFAGGAGVPDMRAGVFLAKLDSLQPLKNAIISDPERWSLAAVTTLVADVLSQPTLADPAGNPTRGTWEEMLDEAAGLQPPKIVGGKRKAQEQIRKRAQG